MIDYTEKLENYDVYFSYVTMLQELTQSVAIGTPFML